MYWLGSSPALLVTLSPSLGSCHGHEGTPLPRGGLVPPGPSTLLRLDHTLMAHLSQPVWTLGTQRAGYPVAASTCVRIS